jgi:integrase
MSGRSTFGSARELPSGRLQASYWHEGNRYKAPQTFSTKADANAYLSGVETDIRRGGWINPLSSAITFRSFAAQWLDQRHDLRQSTSDDYAALLKSHLKPAFGDLALSAITPSKVRGWNAKLSKAHPARAAKAYRMLRTIPGTAGSDRYLLHNPCQVKGASIERVPERKIPTVAEVEALSNAMPERLRLLPLLAAWCGLRRGELLGLTREDF